jgi:aryl-alcohol dehydrogenase-like predicted oxidoreductase
MKRREFLARSVAGLGSIFLTSRFAVGQEPERQFYDPYEIVELGKTKIKVSRLGLGTGMNGWNRESNQTRLGEEKFTALIRACSERGITLLDAADMYGSHPYLVPAMKGIQREKYVIVSKMWLNPYGLDGESRDPKVLIWRFLKELSTDYIDLLQLHCISDGDWNTKMSDAMTDLDNFKKKGIIRAHGLSCHSLKALKTAAQEPWVDAVHARVNAYGDHMDPAGPEEVGQAVKKLHDAGKGVIAMKLVANGEYRDWPEMRAKSIEYVLNLGSVDTMIVGFEKPAEVDDFAAMIRKVEKKRLQEPVAISA